MNKTYLQRMKKLKPVFITFGVILGLYVVSAVIFRGFLYDAPPPIHKAKILMVSLDKDITPETKIETEKKIFAEVPGISSCTINTERDEACIIYRQKENNEEEILSGISKTIEAKVDRFYLKAEAGQKSCPFGGFMQTITPLFTWF